MERTWCYLLPSGETAENMKEGCEKIQLATGHSFSAEAFRSLVRKDAIKKINKITHSIQTKSDATETEANRRR